MGWEEFFLKYNLYILFAHSVEDEHFEGGEGEGIESKDEIIRVIKPAG